MFISKKDNRKYVSKSLPCGTECLFILASDIKKSALSVSINVGNFNDPDNCPGLAHLIEHLIFSGSKNFPNSNVLNTYIAQANGYVNAWTSASYTNFHFDCDKQYIEKGLDILLDMLSLPLFPEHAVTSEVKSIDAEFSMNAKNDVRRLTQIHKETCNLEHPFGKFTVGNKTVFEQFSDAQLSTMCQDFHANYYTCDSISFCFMLYTNDVESQQANACVETLSTKIEEVFDTLQAKRKVPDIPIPRLYKSEHLQQLIQVKPIKYTDNLILTFALPNIEKWQYSKPVLLLSHLLEDERAGGILFLLKEKSWADGLHASSGVTDKNNTDVNVSIQLTSLGSENVLVIIKLCLHYIACIRANGLERWRFDEKAAQLLLQVTHSSDVTPIDEVVTVSERLGKQTLEKIYTQDTTMIKYSITEFDMFLSYFQHTHLRVMHVSHKAKTNKRTQWYDADYSIDTLDLVPVDIEPLVKEYRFELPPKNTFMSESYDIVRYSQSSETPTLLGDNAILTVWFGQPNPLSPKGECYTSLELPYLVGNAYKLATKKIWIACVNEQLERFLGHSELAGIYYRVYPHQGGITIHTSGFSQQQFELNAQIQQQLLYGYLNKEHFERAKQKQIKLAENTLFNKPINQLFTRLNLLFQANSVHHEELIEGFKSLSFDALQQARTDAFQSIQIESLCFGNWTIQEATDFASDTNERFNYSEPCSLTSRQVAKIRRENLLHQFPEYLEEHAVVTYFQAPKISHMCTVLCIVTEQLLSPFFFDELRTKNAVGYLVGTGFMPLNRHPGFACYVQSPHAPPNIIAKAINNCIATFVNMVHEFEPLLPKIKQSLVKQFTNQHSDLSQKAQQYWRDLGEEDGFDQETNMLHQINNLTFSDLQHFIEDLLEQNFSGKIQIVSGGVSSSAFLQDDSNLHVINSVANFKYKYLSSYS